MSEQLAYATLKLVRCGPRRVFSHEEELSEFDRGVKDLAKLRPYALHADTQDVLRQHPHGQNVLLRKTGAIQAYQIERARPSYVQALISYNIS